MHGFILVLLEDEPPARGGGSRRAPVGGQPASRGLPAARGNGSGADVIPIRSTSQLVPKLIGGTDPYIENVLSKAPDIQPGMMGEHYLHGLLPSDDDVAMVSEVEQAVVHPLNETVPDDGDIGAGGGRVSKRNRDLGGDAA